MKAITISERIQLPCPALQVAALSATVSNTESDEALWQEIQRFEDDFRLRYRIEDINQRPSIRATRQAYKALGKDPNRYRPSAESLCRRIVRGLPLYRVNTLVDLINLVSLQSGHSIGGFDEDKIQGDLTLGVGEAGELYHGIGRGELNIQGLPVYRDRLSGIGTPTSDEERTKIDLTTTRLLMIINAYSGADGLKDTVSFSLRLLKQYVSAVEIEYTLIKEGKTTQILLNGD